MSADSAALRMINDSLTQLAAGLNVYFKSPADEDQILNELTHHVAERFGLFDTEESE